MAETFEMYKCSICGNLISIVEAGDGHPVCCGKKMDLLKEKGQGEEKGEKHVPVIVHEGEHVIVKVGSVAHPMDADHFIELIQLFDSEGNVYGKRLKPGEKPEAKFHVYNKHGLHARALCNIHGLWKGK